MSVLLDSGSPLIQGAHVEDLALHEDVVGHFVTLWVNTVSSRAQAYRWGQNNAFYGYHSGHHQGIDGYYVDGLSPTHGAPGSRQHIWTFASGLFAGGGSSSFCG